MALSLTAILLASASNAVAKNSGSHGVSKESARSNRIIEITKNDNHEGKERKEKGKYKDKDKDRHKKDKDKDRDKDKKCGKKKKCPTPKPEPIRPIQGGMPPVSAPPKNGNPVGAPVLSDPGYNGPSGGASGGGGGGPAKSGNPTTKAD